MASYQQVQALINALYGCDEIVITILESSKPGALIGGTAGGGLTYFQNRGKVQSIIAAFNELPVEKKRLITVEVNWTLKEFGLKDVDKATDMMKDFNKLNSGDKQLIESLAIKFLPIIQAQIDK